MNILFCGNSRAFDGILIAVLSITKYYKGELNIYIFTAGLENMREDYTPICWQQARIIENIVTGVCPQSQVFLIDKTQDFKNELAGWVNKDTVYTPYSMLRLYADDILVNRILYLDADVVACDDIEPLYNMGISDFEIAGVRDFLGKWFIEYNYMNTGVLLFNMPRCRENGLFKNARKMCRERKMFFPDQTALNRVCKNKLFLPEKYNEQKRYRPNTVIQHFCKSLRIFPYIHTVNVKPWEIEKLHSIYKLYAHDEILEQYEKIKNAFYINL